MRIFKFIGASLLVLLAVGLLPVTREHLSWRFVTSGGKAQDYAAYLASWPTGRHSADARSRFGELSWATSQKAGDIGSYQRYQNTHPQGAHVAEAATRIEDLRWRQATNANSPNSLRAYDEAYPNGRFAVEAGLRIEDLAWRQATRVNTFESLRNYADRFPNGRFIGEAMSRFEDLWWQITTNGNTIRLYRAYAVAHPQGRFVAEAQNGEAALQQDDTPLMAALAIGTAKSIREFLNDFPGHVREAYALQVLAEITEGRDVVDLLAENKVAIETHGSGIQDVSVRMRRLVPYPLTARIPVGSYFVSSAASAQNMVATTDRKVTLSTDRWHDVSIPAACANRPKDIPNANVTFQVERSPYQAELARLMPVLDKANVSFATRQAAVWIVTDNASYDDLGTLVTRPGFSAFGGTRTIKEEDAVRAIEICAEAGIDVRNKRIWRDWPTISRGRR